MKAQLRRDLRTAMKRGDRGEIALLRELVAALDNAEAAPLRQERSSVDRHAFSDGSAEGERRVLTQEDVNALMLGEMNARVEAAAEFARLGAEARSAALYAEIRMIRRYVHQCRPRAQCEGYRRTTGTIWSGNSPGSGGRSPALSQIMPPVLQTAEEVLDSLNANDKSECRSVAVRYEKIARSFMGVVCIAATLDWIKR
jgi:uncharacterized protein YqeY